MYKSYCLFSIVLQMEEMFTNIPSIPSYNIRDFVLTNIWFLDQEPNLQKLQSCTDNNEFTRKTKRAFFPSLKSGRKGGFLILRLISPRL